MKRIASTIFAVAAVCVAAASCLKLQTNEKYEGEALDPHEYCTAWEFMQKHSDIFSNMMQAVQDCGLKEYYTQTAQTYTYIVFSDDEMAKSVAAYTADPSKKAQLADTLKFHIIKGDYHGYGTLGFMPIDVETLLGPDYRMSMALTGHENSEYEIERIVLMRGLVDSSDEPKSDGANHLCTNGPVHVFSKKAIPVKSN